MNVPHAASLTALQDSLLGPALARAAKSLFYATRLGGLAGLGPRAFDAVPVTTKDDLREAYPFGLLATPRRELASYHESSGTTGAPTSSYFTEADWDDIASRFARNAVDLSADDTVLVKTPYAMVTTAHQMHRAARLRGALVVPADNRSTNMPYPRVVRLLRDLAVTVAWCMPSEVLLWTAAARLAGLDPRRDFLALRAFVVAGEPLGPARKARLEALWPTARVYEDYGSTETGSLAGECAAGRLHLWADRFLPEVYDRDAGSFAREGSGQLVITSFHREAMPLVRYLLEDYVDISSRPCACGSPLPTIRVLGRTPALARSLPQLAAEIDDAVFSLPIGHDVLFYRARGDAATLEAEVEIEVDADAAERATRELTRLLLSRFGIRAEVRAVARGSIVDPARLTAEVPFQKPRFVFARGEDWSTALSY